jgi:hypothetical protein
VADRRLIPCRRAFTLEAVHARLAILAAVLGLAACGAVEADRHYDASPPGVAQLKLTRTSADLGAVPIGLEAWPPTSFEIENVGNATTGILQVTVTGDFSVTSTCGAVGLQPMGLCRATVSFRPRAAGTRSGMLTVAASPGGTVTAALMGTGSTSGPVTVAPTLINFPVTAVGQTSAGQMVTITNHFPVTLSLSLSVSDPLDFSVANNCSRLAGVSSCTAVVTFAPLSKGAKNATLSITSGPHTLTIQLTGVAQEPALLNIEPSTLSFAGIRDQPSAPQRFIVRNVGEMTSGALELSLMGTNSADFTITDNDCGPLADQAMCHIDVVYQPTGPGTRLVKLVVSASPGGPVLGTLIGIADNSPVLEVTPPSPVDLGTVDVGKRSPTRTLSVKNTLAVPTSLLTVILASSEFAVVADTCNVALAPQAICTIEVAITPASAGTKSAVLGVSGWTAGQTLITLNATAR